MRNHVWVVERRYRKAGGPWREWRMGPAVRTREEAHLIASWFKKERVQSHVCQFVRKQPVGRHVWVVEQKCPGGEWRCIGRLYRTRERARRQVKRYRRTSRGAAKYQEAKLVRAEK